MQARDGIFARGESTRVFWALQLGGWTAYAVALMVPWLGRYPLSVMWSNKLVIAGTGLATSSALRLVYQRLSRETTSPIATALVAAVASVTGAFVWNGVASALLGRSLQHDSLFLGALGRTWPRFDGVLYHALVLFSWSLLYLGVRHYRALAAERERSFRAESLAREARLLALRYQIGPHFLFNALNAISTLVVADRKADATAAIARLADLLRVSLHPPEAGLITLRTELQLVRDYIAIERMRFGDRLQIAMHIDSPTLDVLVPAMILQPLVENAVRHGVATRDEPTCVTIRAQLVAAGLALSVDDDAPSTGGVLAGLGVGLANTRARIDELYGSAGCLVTGLSPGGGFRAALTLPVDRRPAERTEASESLEVQPA